MAPVQFHRLQIAEVVTETDQAHSLVFALPDGLRDAFAYRPGQFLTLRVPVDGVPLQRCYSLSSTPEVDNALRVTIKRVQSGRVSNWICDHLGAGDTVEVMPPAGVFTPPALHGDFLLLAGGSGITPVLSIAKAALRHGRGAVTLVYANRDERSIIFREALAELARNHPGRLRVIHWLDSVQGPPTQRQIEELVRPWSMAQCFVCGPGPFMDGAQAALQALGVPRGQLHVERFVSLPDVPAAKAPASGAASAGDTATASPAPAMRGAALTVQLDGEIHHVGVALDETVLDALQRAGVAAPNSCRAGLCGACMCQVTQGDVTLGENHVLDRADLEAGWTLACQARPSSAEIHLKFPD
ncbi:Flavodoxin/ferredoxin--NADP reductase [Cupriavidus necator]|uniref:Ferredoxin--NADP reductase n=1 Tax=Cupriavidus necator (strain ATCC 17699 / DSM 428 / KCTC 22496 / NCIMB 10442 / H16 / Stanier 337) TaxID=381666 RepID=Q0K3I4_CUPNH|nr:ferredoxin--NADP reductase [Cupriavidus necator]QCC03345.1 ferredoxin--NADP reductase [Cupriavidus necator H16]QQB80401.1 ferredoxin--NADP reductase [Cupriavidus necator]WKA44679.1 ferredoxin--NADP reductase [Cupriavidus necator]CAJ95440.1 flavodoxin reductase (ferredoxin-NADPH reductase) family 1 [Cupriavidus necator H16]